MASHLALLALVGALCILSTLAHAQGSCAAGDSNCLPPWMTTPAPAFGFDVEYPNNSVVYTRQHYVLPAKSFFSAHWYVGIIIIVLVVLIVYTLLAVWVCCHFEFLEQRRAKKVVEEAYLTNGFFDMEGRRPSGEGGNGRRGSGGSNSRATLSTFVPSGSYDDRYGSSGSYSDGYDGSDSPTPSENDDDAVVDMNPLGRSNGNHSNNRRR